jgi:lipopolysaccharide/colanic/teichoic acid biosynthesis glycosyltransferase
MTNEKAGRRMGKELRERLLAAGLLLLTAPVAVLCAAAIKLEGLLRPGARGPVFFRERRMAQGREFELLKFRTLTASALAGLGDGPTHIAVLESAGQMTLAGRFIKQWYLDELPQLINVARGEMGLIGTRPWPLELYAEEMAKGITRKRDMPSGLIGPVQASKGTRVDGLELDLAYFELYRSGSGWALLKADALILLRSLGVMAKHEGI